MTEKFKKLLDLWRVVLHSFAELSPFEADFNVLKQHNSITKICKTLIKPENISSSSVFYLILLEISDQKRNLHYGIFSNLPGDCKTNIN